MPGSEPGSRARLSMEWPTAPESLSLTHPRQSSSRPSSPGFGSSHAPGPSPTPPWSTPPSRLRTPSQRKAVTCAWCSCWEPGGSPALAQLPPNPKSLLSASPPAQLLSKSPRVCAKAGPAAPTTLSTQGHQPGANTSQPLLPSHVPPLLTCLPTWRDLFKNHI